MLDLFSHYFPDFADLTAEELQSMRTRLVTWLQTVDPDLDVRVGSPFGAGGVDPLAAVLTGVEVMLDRMRSDHTTSAVAAGTVWDCDYVENYLAALGGKRQETVTTHGHLRLEFGADVDVNIPTGLQFLLNSSDVFLAYVQAQQPLRILRSGSTRTTVNDFVLTPYTDSSFAVLVPVYGTPTSDVVAGAEAEISQAVDNLVSVTAAYDFTGGRSSNSVPAIARRAAQAYAASGFVTRGGTREQLFQIWPDLVSVGVVMSGDQEQLRGAVNPLGIASGAVDIHVRSISKTTFTQTVRLNYYPDQEAAAVDKFIGTWDPIATPIRLVSVMWVGNTELQLLDGANPAHLLSRSLDAGKAPLLTCAFSSLEELTFVIDMPRSAANAPLIATEVDADGQAYALFDVVFVGDPAVDAVQRYVDAETPAGIDVLVRAPCPIVFEQLEVGYSKQPGHMFNVAQAQAETESYLLNLAAPARFSAAKLYDIAYYAGAEDINYTAVRARLLLSVAKFVLPAGADDPSVDYAACMAQALELDNISINDVRGLAPSYRDPRMGESTSRMGVASHLNISYELPPDTVSFQPQQTS